MADYPSEHSNKAAWKDVLEDARHTLDPYRLGFALRQWLGQHDGPRYPKPDRGYFPLGLDAGIGSDRACEALSYFHWLTVLADRYPQIFHRAFAKPQPTRWLDVGAKNWSYVAALVCFMQNMLTGLDETEEHHPAYNTNTDSIDSCQPFRIDGVELDPGRRYTDLRTRGQMGRAYAANSSNALSCRRCSPVAATGTYYQPVSTFCSAGTPPGLGLAMADLPAVGAAPTPDWVTGAGRLAPDCEPRAG